jgi:heme oxygenase
MAVVVYPDFPVADLRSRLRHRTGSLHAAVDAAVGPLLTPGDYCCYLAGLAAFRAPYEAALVGASPAFLGDWRMTPLMPSLARDMADLGVAPLGPVHRGALPAPDDDTAAGWLYVLEGSALGARLVAKRADALGFGPGRGGRHLALQCRNWKSFRLFAERLDVARLDEGRVVAAAGDAFAAAESAFLAAGRHEVADAAE